MGKVLMSGAGGGVKSDDVTASKWDVVQGKKTITTDSDDEVGEGTLPEHDGDVGSMSSSLYIPGNLYYSDFPKGAYRRSDIGEAGGRVVVPLERLRHDIGYTNVNKVLSDTSIAGQQGGIPFQNAETDGDRAWATIINCWEGQANFGVRNGHYLNGVNHIRGNIPNFFAANIKKGVNMGGLVGTFEGYVAGPTDLYNRGNNPYNFTGYKVTNETGGLRFLGYSGSSTYMYFRVASSGAFNFTPYSKLRIWFLVDQVKYYSDSNYAFGFSISNGSSVIARATINGNLNTMYMMEMNIASYSATSILSVEFDTKFYNDASGSDSDPSWSAEPFNAWIYQIAVA